MSCISIMFTYLNMQQNFDKEFSKMFAKKPKATLSIMIIGPNVIYNILVFNTGPDS